MVETLLASLDKLADFKAKLNAEANAAATTIQDENPVIATSIKAALVTFNVDFTGAGKIDEVTANLHDLYSKMQAANTDTKVKNILNVNAVNFDAELKKLENYTPLNTQAGIVSTVNAFANVGANLTAVGIEIKKVEGKTKTTGR